MSIESIESAETCRLAALCVRIKNVLKRKNASNLTAVDCYLLQKGQEILDQLSDARNFASGDSSQAAIPSVEGVEFFPAAVTAFEALCDTFEALKTEDPQSFDSMISGLKAALSEDDTSSKHIPLAIEFFSHVSQFFHDRLESSRQTSIRNVRLNSVQSSVV